MKIFEYMKILHLIHKLWNKKQKPKKIKQLTKNDDIYLFQIPKINYNTSTISEEKSIYTKIPTAVNAKIHTLTFNTPAPADICFKMPFKTYEKENKWMIYFHISSIFYSRNYRYLWEEITKKQLNKTIALLCNTNEYQIYLTTDKKQILKKIKQYNQLIFKITQLKLYRKNKNKYINIYPQIKTFKQKIYHIINKVNYM